MKINFAVIGQYNYKRKIENVKFRRIADI